MKVTTGMRRRSFLRAGILAAALGIAAATSASAAYPERTIRLVVPYPAGGSVDFIARVLQPKLQDVLGQTVIIENRGGASGMIGSSAVAKAEPDGYTLLLGGVQTHAMNAAVIKTMMYDSLKDFTPIIETTAANWILAANPKFGIKTPADLVKVAKAKPDGLTYASSGKGSAAHLAFSLLASDLGISIVHVPYKGIAQGITDTLGGQVSMVMGDTSTLLQHIQSGALVAVAMTGDERSPMLPNVPTIAETLIPGFDVRAWQGIWGPPGMSPELTKTINAAFQKVLSDPAVAERLKAGGVNPIGGSVEQFNKFTRSEYERWTATARKANITPE